MNLHGFDYTNRALCGAGRFEVDLLRDLANAFITVMLLPNLHLLTIARSVCAPALSSDETQRVYLN